MQHGGNDTHDEPAKGGLARTPVRKNGRAELPLRRCECSPVQVEALHDHLESRLRRVGVESVPSVAGHVLELAQNSESTLKEYAKAVRADWNLSGRVLRMANSAFYAQRSPVTTLERALVVLGTERTKAIALGFYLSRLANTSGDRLFTRKVWGESVYRAALCEQLARVYCPALTGEAFIVGLMLDAGQPIMMHLLGSKYRQVVDEAGSPAKLFALEHDRLECTHVDVLAALARRWKLPRLIVRPLLWHHTLPPVGQSGDPAVLLHRLAYYAGSIQLGAGQLGMNPIGSNPLAGDLPRSAPAQLSTAVRLFELPIERLEEVCGATSTEYQSVLGLFDDVAQRLDDLENIGDRVRVQLVELMDDQLARALRMETRGGAEHLIVAGQNVEIEPGNGNQVAAYISTDDGQRLVSCTVNPHRESPESIARLLGIEDAMPHEVGELVRVMRRVAA